MQSIENEIVVSKRQQNRQARKSIILDAARTILITGGAEALVIRRLADMAETTPRTIYAIFGSKAGVLRDLYFNVGALPSAFSSSTPQDLIQTLDSLGATVDRITSEAALTRPLIAALQNIGLDKIRIGMEENITRTLAQTFESCRLCGELESLVSPRMLAQQVVLTFIQGMRRWSQHGMPDAALRAYTLFGITLLLLGAATPEARQKLTQLLQDQQATLARLGLS